MMKHYEKLLAKGSFSREQLIEIVGTATAANQVIYEYQKKGLIEKVKRDFYVVISMETKQPVLSRYQIGSNLFPDACITHHSAFEVFGYGSQVFYECYVATDKRFHDFEYDGVLYRHIERKPDIEVVQQGKIRVTSMEQTVVDSIRDFEKLAKKYGVDFAVRKDKSVDPPRFLVFVRSKDADALDAICKEHQARALTKNEKPSVLAQLKKFKEIVAAIPKKVREKKQERDL